MQNLTMGFENVIATNGITISIVGIVIVFSALSIIALFIALLPKILPLTEWLLPTEEHAHASTASKSADHDEILAAIASALFHKQAASLPTK